jgi:hypothetical protein
MGAGDEMTDADDWEEIPAQGAEVERQVRRLAGTADDGPRILAAALAWALLLRYWSGAPVEILHRWRNDLPEAMAELAVRGRIVPRQH